MGHGCHHWRWRVQHGFGAQCQSLTPHGEGNIRPIGSVKNVKSNWVFVGEIFSLRQLVHIIIKYCLWFSSIVSVMGASIRHCVISCLSAAMKRSCWLSTLIDIGYIDTSHLPPLNLHEHNILYLCMTWKSNTSSLPHASITYTVWYVSSYILTSPGILFTCELC